MATARSFTMTRFSSLKAILAIVTTTAAFAHAAVPGREQDSTTRGSFALEVHRYRKEPISGLAAYANAYARWGTGAPDEIFARFHQLAERDGCASVSLSALTMPSLRLGNGVLMRLLSWS
jgi:hypothetical protein